jgi:hypothetical protein
MELTFQVAAPWSLLHNLFVFACLWLQDVAVVTYESEDAATRAVRMMDGTNMPSGRTMHVSFAPLPGLSAVHSAAADLAPAGANGEGVTNSVSNNTSMPFSTAGFGAGSGFDIFGGDAAAAAALAAANLQGGMFGGQGWNGASAAARPPFAGSMFGADLNNNRGASWDGSGIAAANAAGRPPMPGLFGGRGQQQQQQQQFGGVTGRHSISGPPSGSMRAVSPVGGMPPVYMASPVGSMPGGVGGASPSPGANNLFARPGSVGNGLGGNAALLAGGNAADLSPFGLHAGGIGGLGADFGYGSAGAAVSDALLELSEEASRMHQQQQGGMAGVTGVTPGGVSPNAWGSLAGWDGGAANVMGVVGSAAGPNAAAAAAGVGTSEGQGSSRSSSVAGGSQGRLSGMNDAAGMSAATAGSESVSSLTGAGSS